MSRIGNKLIQIPEKVSIIISGCKIKVEGPRGSLEREMHPSITLEKNDLSVAVSCNKTEKSTALQGLSRTLINNMIQGVTAGFSKELIITGVGYRAEAKGTELHMTLGYSHPVVFKLPVDVIAITDSSRTSIRLESINKEILGETAAKIRSFRPPEPYRGKGIRYSNETIKRKEGKSAGK